MNTVNNTIKSNTIECKKLSSLNGTIDFNLQTGQFETNVGIRKDK